jgi:hypothetical protein
LNTLSTEQVLAVFDRQQLALTYHNRQPTLSTPFARLLQMASPSTWFVVVGAVAFVSSAVGEGGRITPIKSNGE